MPGGWLWAPRLSSSAAEAASHTDWLWPGQSSRSASSREALVVLRWRVGGAFAVDSTDLLLGCVPSGREAQRQWWDDWQAAADAGPHDLDAMVAARAILAAVMPTTTPGSLDRARTGRWGSNDLSEWESFEASVHVRPEMCVGGSHVFAIARAVVDSAWATAPSRAQPAGLGPQSHYANARTNPSWRHVLNGQVVQGRARWYSPPLVFDGSSSRSHHFQSFLTRQDLHEESVPGTAAVAQGPSQWWWVWMGVGLVLWLVAIGGFGGKRARATTDGQRDSGADSKEARRSTRQGGSSSSSLPHSGASLGGPALAHGDVTKLV